MTFGLKNVGVTYQKFFIMAFNDKIGSIVELYIDDMVVKSPVQGHHIQGLEEIFDRLAKYNMRLNGVKSNFSL